MKKEQNRIYKGMNTDNSPIFQPEDSTTYCLNTLNEGKDGSRHSLVSEESNSLCGDFGGDNFRAVGSITLNNDDKVMFLMDTQDSNAATGQNLSIIGILDNNCKFTVLIKAYCLDFRRDKQVRGFHRVRRGCERTVYFTDGYNKLKSINIDALDQYLYSGETQTTANASASGWDCEKFDHILSFKYPCISLVSVNSSGGNGRVRVGAVQFAIQYLDESLNPTPYTALTNPIIIIDESSDLDYEFIDGANPDVVSNTNKSITLQFKELDTTFTYIRVAVGESIEGTGFMTNAYAGDILIITSSTLDYTFRGADDSWEPLNVKDLVSPKLPYDIVEDIDHINDSMILAGISERSIKHELFQREALKITCTYLTKFFGAEDPDPTRWSPKSPAHTFLTRSLMRDEVYALGIQWIFNDGYETPVYHIASRPKNKATKMYFALPWVGGNNLTNANPDGTFTIDPSQGSGTNNGETIGGTANEHNRDFWNGIPGLWDFQQVVQGINTEHLGGFSKQRWEVFNTALRTHGDRERAYTIQNAAIGLPGSGLGQYEYSRGELAYWESEKTYPDTTACDGKKVYATYDSTGTLIKDFSGDPIRHHKMPDTTLEPHFIGYGNTEPGVLSNDAWIIPLGLDFENISPPSEYSDDLLGYRIVISDRDDTNRTIVEKGLFYHNAFSLVDKSGGSTYTKYNFQTSTYGIHRNSITGLHHNKHSGPVPRWWLGTVDTGNASFAIIPAYPANTQLSSAIGVAEGSNISKSHRDYNSFSFHGPVSKFYKQAFSEDFIKIERVLAGKVTYLGESASSEFGDHGFVDPNPGGWYRFASHATYDNSSIPNVQETNRKINTAAYVNPDMVVAGSLSNEFINRTQQETYVFETEDTLDIDSLPFSNDAPGDNSGVDSIRNAPTHNTTYTRAYYGALKRNNPSVYGDIYSIKYRPMSSCVFSSTSTNTRGIFGGDIHIAKFYFRKTQWNDDDDVGHHEETGVITDNKGSFEATMQGYWCESEINSELRNEGDPNNTCERYYPKSFSTDISSFVLLEDEDSDFDNEPVGSGVVVVASNSYYLRNYCKNYYEYNVDYSKTNKELSSFPVPISHRFCSDCLSNFPHRIAYSMPDAQENIADSYRVFLPGDFQDISADTGEIRDIFVLKDQLYTITENSLWRMYTKEQTLKTSAATLYVGTGEMFSNPPVQIYSATTGFGGSGSRFSGINSKHGYTYASPNHGKVYNMSEKVDEFSSLGMRNFFYDNLPIEYEKWHKGQFGVEYSLKDSPVHPAGTGVIATYDTRHERYILTKKDWEYIGPDIKGVYDPSAQYYYGDTVIYNEQLVSFLGLSLPGGGTLPPNVTELDGFPINSAHSQSLIDVSLGAETWISNMWSPPLSKDTFWKNKGFTVSYSYLTKSWASFHSYIPNHYSYDRETFFSFIDSDDIWKHGDKSSSLKFYGNPYPHIIEFVLNKGAQSKQFYTVQYISRVEGYDSGNEQYYEIPYSTFTEIIAYTQKQCTGKVSLTVKNTADPYASVSYSNTDALVDRVNETWRISQLRDFADHSQTESLFSIDWQYLKDEFPIDKVINPNSIDTTKSQYSQSFLEDQYLIVRLSFDGRQDHRIVTDILGSLNQATLR